MRVDLSHLREHKFKNSFQYTLNLICNCGKDIETTSRDLLHCPDYLHERKTLLNTVSCIVPYIFDFNNDQLTEILSYDKEDLDNTNNTSILHAAKIYCRAFLMNSGCRGFNVDIALKIQFFLKFFSLICF